MKKVILSLILCTGLFAEILEVSARTFQGNEKKGESLLEGNVEVKKAGDWLKADRVKIFTDSKRKLKSIEAQDKVTFLIHTQDNRTIYGKCDKLIYDAETKDYHLLKNVHVKEKGKDNEIKGDEIILNNTTGYVNVVGTKNKPAKIIFDLDNDDK